MATFKTFISFPPEHMYETAQHYHYIIVNIDGECIMRATLSNIPYNEFQWRLTELSYCEDLEEQQKVLRRLIDCILKNMSDTNYYFYVADDNSEPSIIKDCPWLNLLEDNIYVCRATKH